jgi:hypothetical protein
MSLAIHGSDARWLALAVMLIHHFNSECAAAETNCTVPPPPDTFVISKLGRSVESLDSLEIILGNSRPNSLAILADTLDLSEGGEIDFYPRAAGGDATQTLEHRFVHVIVVANELRLGRPTAFNLHGVGYGDGLRYAAGGRLSIVSNRIVLTAAAQENDDPALLLNAEPNDKRFNRPGELAVYFNSIELQGNLPAHRSLQKYVEALTLGDAEKAASLTLDSTDSALVLEDYSPENPYRTAQWNSPRVTTTELEQRMREADLWETSSAPTAWLTRFFQARTGFPARNTVDSSTSGLIRADAVRLVRYKDTSSIASVNDLVFSHWLVDNLRSIQALIQRGVATADWQLTTEAAERFRLQPRFTQDPSASECYTRAFAAIEKQLSQARTATTEQMNVTHLLGTSSLTLVRDGMSVGTAIAPTMLLLNRWPDGSIGAAQVLANGSYAINLRGRLSVQEVELDAVRRALQATRRQMQGLVVLTSIEPFDQERLPMGVAAIKCTLVSQLRVECRLEVLPSPEGHLFLFSLASPEGVELPMRWQARYGSAVLSGSSTISLSLGTREQPPIAATADKVRNTGERPVRISYVRVGTSFKILDPEVDIPPKGDIDLPYASSGEPISIPESAVSVLREVDADPLDGLARTGPITYGETITVRNSLPKLHPRSGAPLSSVVVTVTYQYRLSEADVEHEQAPCVLTLLPAGTPDAEGDCAFAKVDRRHIRVEGVAHYGSDGEVPLNPTDRTTSLIVLTESSLPP